MKYLFIVIVIFFTYCHQKIDYPTGGLNYPVAINSKDSNFYIYQYIDSLSTLDSLQEAAFGRYFIKGFHEPNLSIHPQKHEMFRLLYNSWTPFVVTVSHDKIIIKKKLKGWLYPYYNLEKLSKYEQAQISRTEWYFRMSKSKKENFFWIQHIDSLLKIYPHMKDIVYYQNTLEKVAEYKPFQYSVDTIPISVNKFDSLISLVNKSGYWSMPRESDCKNTPLDADRFTLEANTQEKYKIVQSFSCPDDNRKFTIACQAIINAAGLSKEINLLWDGTTISVPIPEVPLKNNP